jgi:hypothetical protein
MSPSIYWLAGLLEGEGCFWCGKGGRVLIRLAMTDQDIIERAAAVMGGHIEKPRRPNGGSHLKTVYAVRVRGDDAILWMQRLRPLMGRRRQSKIDEVLAFAAARPGRRFNAAGGVNKPGRGSRDNRTHCSNGHELTSENVYTDAGPSGYLYLRCRICRQERENTRRKFRRENELGYRERVNARSAVNKRKNRAVRKAA